MKISLNALKYYVDINVPVSELCDRMVMAGFEVESIEKQGGRKMPLQRFDQCRNDGLIVFRSVPALQAKRYCEARINGSARGECLHADRCSASR